MGTLPSTAFGPPSQHLELTVAHFNRAVIARHFNQITSVKYIAYTWHTWYIWIAMNKTIYIRDEDTPIWDRARELAGDKLSPIIVAGLRRFIAEKEAEEAESQGFERIEVSYNDAEQHGIPKKKAFTGKWIYSLDEPLELSSEDGMRSWYYAVAQTVKRNFAFLSWESDYEGKDNYRFRVFPSLEAAAADNDLNTAARHTIRKLGVAVEELDI